MIHPGSEREIVRGLAAAPAQVVRTGERFLFTTLRAATRKIAKYEESASAVPEVAQVLDFRIRRSSLRMKSIAT